MDHSLLSIWDLVIIGAYLLLMVLVGVYSVRRIKNTGDYYVAGRSFGPLSSWPPSVRRSSAEAV